MKTRLFPLLLLASLGVRADGEDATAAATANGTATNLTIVSNTETRKGWRRDVVMEEGTNLVDRSGTIASKADSAAVATVAEKASEVADAATAAMEGAVGELGSMTNQVPERAQHVLLCVRPDLAARATLTFLLTDASISADGKTLSFTATANRLTATRPAMTLSFGDGVNDDATAKVTWTGDWDASSASHPGSAEIPAAYRGRPAALFENVTFGDASGLFDFGSVLVAVGGKTAWNGTVTNSTGDASLKVENGFFKQPTGASK